MLTQHVSEEGVDTRAFEERYILAHEEDDISPREKTMQTHSTFQQ